MPAKVTDSEETEVVKIRLSVKLKADCSAARGSGAHSNQAESTFLGYLLRIGLARYTQAILPVELGGVAEEVDNFRSQQEAASGS